MYRSQKFLNDDDDIVDYKTLYLQEKKLKEEFQKRSELAELRLRKLSQTVNKKCIRCMKIDQKQSKFDKIKELKQFRSGLSDRNLNLFPKKNINFRRNHPIIQNFAIFGAPESILTDPIQWEETIESQLLYISDFPTDTALHSSKLAFPHGVIPKYYSGADARQKSIQIMSKSCAFQKSFIMTFEKQQKQEQVNDLLNIMNPEKRLYAICISIEDFTMVPYLPTKYFESEKFVIDKPESPTSSQQEERKTSMKIQKCLSCDQTSTNPTTINLQKQCHIVTTPRVYCIFSKYPFLHFYQQLLKSIINSVKTERLVVYRQSGCAVTEADSHFFKERVKITFKELYEQIENWQLKMNKQLELKLITCQRLTLKLYPDQCKYNFVQEWGIPILKLFSPQSLLDIFMLIMLEEKVVFVCENKNLLTYTIQLFTRLLPRPFKYPYPTQYLNSPFPVVYGYCAPKSEMIQNNLVNIYKNTYVFLQTDASAEIISQNLNKTFVKKRPEKLMNFLTQTFKTLKGHHNKRVSTLTFTDNRDLEYQKDKTGISVETIKAFNRYLQENIINNLPKKFELEQIRKKILKKGIEKNRELNQEILNAVCKEYKNKTKDAFFDSLLETQIISSYLFP